MKLAAMVLQYLLFMDPSIGLEYSLTTQHCNLFDSTSAIRPCNRVMHTDMPTAQEVEQIKSYFDGRPFSWAVEEQDTAVRNFLESYQLATRFSFPAMSMPLDMLPERACDIDCVIQRIDHNNTQELNRFVSTFFDAGFTIDRPQLEKVIHRVVSYVAPEALRLYVGYYQGQLAAVGMSLQHSTVATLHWIGVLPAYRRKGLGSAITYRMLVDLRNAGCSHTYLLSSEMGKSLYERMGFKEYIRYAMYCNY